MDISNTGNVWSMDSGFIMVHQRHWNNSFKKIQEEDGKWPRVTNNLNALDLRMNKNKMLGIKRRG